MGASHVSSHLVTFCGSTREQKETSFENICPIILRCSFSQRQEPPGNTHSKLPIHADDFPLLLLFCRGNVEPYQQSCPFEKKLAWCSYTACVKAYVQVLLALLTGMVHSCILQYLGARGAGILAVLPNSNMRAAMLQGAASGTVSGEAAAERQAGLSYSTLRTLPRCHDTLMHASLWQYLDILRCSVPCCRGQRQAQSALRQLPRGRRACRTAPFAHFQDAMIP